VLTGFAIGFASLFDSPDAIAQQFIALCLTPTLG